MILTLALGKAQIAAFSEKSGIWLFTNDLGLLLRSRIPEVITCTSSYKYQCGCI
ncbi:MAG: hypothetical protein V7K21_10585 [Nostoc sp.]|uniref:hypothetical protein n=1 Tax=Nostoc sp. TaxID=1180 RepID=UPI002FFB6F4C